MSDDRGHGQAKEKQEIKEGKQEKHWPKVRRVFAVIGMVYFVLLGVIYLAVFIEAIIVGYLSRIGIAVGSIFFLYMVIGTSLPTIRKDLAKKIKWINAGVIVAIIAAVAAVVLWPDSGGAWRTYRFDEDLAKIEAARAVPDEENAAIRYDRVLSRIDMNDRSELSLGEGVSEYVLREPWTKAEYPEASEWLDGYSEVISRLLLIGRMDKCRWPVRGDFLADYTVEPKKLRQCLQLLIAAGNRDIGEGLFNRGLGKYFCALRMAEHQYQQPDVINLYLGFDFEGAALRAISRLLVEHKLSATELYLIENHLPRGENQWETDWQRILEVKKLRYKNRMGAVYEVSGEGKVRFGSSRSPWDEDVKKLGRMDRLRRLYWLINMPWDPAGARTMADKVFAKFYRTSYKAYIPFPYEKVPVPFLSLENVSKLISNWYRAMTEMFFVEMSEGTMSHRIYLRHIARQRGVIVLLALSKYKNKYGNWPESINDVAGLVHTDAFIDPLNKQGFVYRLEGDGFRLYSAGFNGVDEEGVRECGNWLEEGRADDISIWPRQVNKKGKDK